MYIYIHIYIYLCVYIICKTIIVQMSSYYVFFLKKYSIWYHTLLYILHYHTISWYHTNLCNISIYYKYKSQLVFAPARGAPALSDRNTSRSASCGTPRGNARTWLREPRWPTFCLGIWVWNPKFVSELVVRNNKWGFNGAIWDKYNG